MSMVYLQRKTIRYMDYTRNQLRLFANTSSSLLSMSLVVLTYFTAHAPVNIILSCKIQD